MSDFLYTVDTISFPKEVFGVVFFVFEDVVSVAPAVASPALEADGIRTYGIKLAVLMMGSGGGGSCLRKHMQAPPRTLIIAKKQEITHTLLFQLRYLQTLNNISAEKNSTIVFPVPVDIITHLMGGGKGRSEPRPPPSPPVPAHHHAAPPPPTHAPVIEELVSNYIRRKIHV